MYCYSRRIVSFLELFCDLSFFFNFLTKNLFSFYSAFVFEKNLIRYHKIVFLRLLKMYTRAILSNTRRVAAQQSVRNAVSKITFLSILTRQLQSFSFSNLGQILCTDKRYHN